MGKLDKKDIRRREIVAAAQAVAAREGAEGATLRAIAAEAGMAANAVLYYYGSHAEIIAAALEAASARFLEKVAHAVEGEVGPTARLAAVINAGTIADLEDDVSRILYEYWPHSLRDPELRRIQAEFSSAQQRIYREIIEDGVRTGEFVAVIEPDKIARTLVAQEDGLVMDVLAGIVDGEYVLDLFGSLAAALLGIEKADLMAYLQGRTVGVRD
ncbi:TetR family transcriptional regulator C-terminal domain-containing protein [Paenarthrobacter sp. NPDC089322]|uniref:TetR family transcriptional regulator C-terminal domain-containing protein n=1 Tax=Paenarthrobacter sp. NPDC089322 TaxID=3155065 RepID=UPI00341FEF3A